MKIIVTILVFISISFSAHGSNTANPEDRRIVDFLMVYETMREEEITEALRGMNFRDIQLIQRVLGYDPSPSPCPLSLNSESEEEISSYIPLPRSPSFDDENEKDAEYP